MLLQVNLESEIGMVASETIFTNKNDRNIRIIMVVGNFQGGGRIPLFPTLYVNEPIAVFTK